MPFKSCFSQCCVSFGGSMVGLMAMSSKRANAIPRSAAMRVSAPAADHCWPVLPQETWENSKTCLAHSLWGLLVCTRFCLSPLSIFGRYGFDSKHDFVLSSIFLGPLLCPWVWDFFWWDPTFFCRWFFSSELQFWSSHRRRWAQVLWLHLVLKQNKTH